MDKIEICRENLEFVLDGRRVLAGFSTRLGSVSGGAYAGLNLGDHVGDDPQNVAQNREILAAALGIGPQNLKFMRQIHSNKVEILRADSDEIPPCDGLVTDLRGVALCVLVADCSPVLIADERRGVVAAVHAGRAGVIGRICTSAIDLMSERFGCVAAELKVFVGVNIKARNYELGGLDLGEFERYKTQGHFDMNAALRDELAAAGVRNVKFDPRCTFESERHFSYRRDGVTGRFCGFVMNKLCR